MHGASGQINVRISSIFMFILIYWSLFRIDFLYLEFREFEGKGQVIAFIFLQQSKTAANI